MSFLELVRNRQSVRRYASILVEKEKIQTCLEAARLAPSASNSQPWTFIVVDDPDKKEELASYTYDKVLTFNKFVHQAPVLVVFVVEKPKLITHLASKVKKLNYPLIDCGISAEHFCLQAAEEGLGTCMLGWFREKPIMKLLNIPAGKMIGLIVTLGYAEEGYKIREKIRKTSEEVVRFNSYNKK
jgi:nitroreductase